MTEPVASRATRSRGIASGQAPRGTRGRSERSRPGPDREDAAERSQRAAQIEFLGFREDLRGRFRLPLLLALLLLTLGATRFVETRQVVAEVAAVAAPVVLMTAAVAPLREALPRLRNTAFAVAGALVFSAETLLLPHVLDVTFAPIPPPTATMLGLNAALVAIEAMAVRRGFSIRPAALGGMVTALALSLPRLGTEGDALGSLLAAGMVAVFIGGGLGFAAGIAARTAVGARA